MCISDVLVCLKCSVHYSKVCVDWQATDSGNAEESQCTEGKLTRSKGASTGEAAAEDGPTRRASGGAAEKPAHSSDANIGAIGARHTITVPSVRSYCGPTPTKSSG